MRLIFTSLFLVSVAAAALAATDGAQRTSIPLSDPSRPATVMVSTVNGGISVEGYGGREIQVESSARADDGDEAPRHGAEGMQRIPNTGTGFSAAEDNNVVRIDARTFRHGSDLRIKVPAHSSVHLSAVNGGDLHVSGVEGEIELSNVNGSIEGHDLAGSVVAHTTNGSIKLALRRLDAGKPMAFSTLNGDVDVTFPAALKADVRMRSDRGDIYSDFEVGAADHAVTQDTRKDGKRHIEVSHEIHGAVNGGGPEILFKTFNGDIFLRRLPR